MAKGEKWPPDRKWGKIKVREYGIPDLPFWGSVTGTPGLCPCGNNEWGMAWLGIHMLFRCTKCGRIEYV